MKFLTVRNKQGERVEIAVDAIESLTCINGDHTQIRTISGKTYMVEENSKKIGGRIAHASSNTETL